MMFGDQAFPNITGKVGWDANGFLNYATDAFSGIAKTGSYVVSGSSSGEVPYKYADFSAQRSSSVFGNKTVQPRAIQILIIIKAWIDGDWTLFEPP